MSKKTPQIRFKGFTDDWVQRKLGDLIEEKWIVRQSDGNHGNLYPRSEEFVDSGVPYVAASNISSDGNSIDFSTVKYLPQSRADLFKKGVAFDGDILLAHNATVGPALRLHTSFDKVILSTTLTLYRVDSEKIDPDFFLQNLRSSKFQNQLFETMKQSTRNQVPILTQQKLSISITSNLDEQERIGKLLTLLDDLIAANQRKLDLLKEQKKGYLQKMFPKNGAKVPELRFAGFADDWEERKLKDIAQFNPKTVLPDEFEYVDLESVVGTEMISHRTESKDQAPSRAQRLAQKGDVFYQTVRPYQMNNYLYDLPYDNYVFSTGYAQMRPNIDSYFLLNSVQNKQFVQQVLDRSTGTSYPAINSSDLSNIEIHVPSKLSEQQKIGAFFQSIDDTIALHQRKLDLLKEQKKGFLQKMFVS
ncbi:restriction endonuclease subunit S [Leuconostoc mesenteroides]|nr:restriction endonuclease subunit S [Leuconostoc mesenteroides]MBZ1518893.1 restriction endonuclease subunit S [Leuconostoc mesenteroides]MBZ1521557.1 restriction endonuclease subunit S [Leuconostoc mesenteroides]